jgi:WD40 repeat protein
MEICLREIARCQEQSPRPNFIVLLGERYGWRPLPDRVLQRVETKMKPEMPSEIQSLFRQWYELDENQLPEPVWKLRAREGRYIDYNEYEKTIQKPLVAFFTQWSAENLPDPELPENKTNPLALQRLSMERSATEQEIQTGAFSVEDAREHVFAFFRNIPDCPKENLNWHDSDQNPVQRLRSHLKSYLHEANISEFSAGWDKEKNQPDTTHLEKLSNDVENALKVIIDREIENYQLSSEHELEQAAHEAFASERTFGFSGRENDIAAICEYTAQNNNTPFVVWGESGTGKSTLMAMAARKVQETFPQTHVITRFIAVTGKSANGHTLLADICRNICVFYGGDPAEIPEDPAKLQYAFREYLAKATEEHPLVLFLDALDQLNEGDPARLLQWLPEVLPLNVKLVLSTLKGVSFDVLRVRKDPALFFYEITPLTATDGRNALSAWLKRANRTLQSHQTDQIIRDFECAGCAPLYLHLAFEQAQHWESYTRRQRLGRDIPEMIEEFYGYLSRPEAHGPIVEKVLTAIRCTKQGLSDDEILGVLAADDEFWNSFGIQTYHIYDDGEKTTITSRLIPPVLWIRLYHDLEYYLTRRNAPGGEVITFYHRQLAEAIDSMYLQRPGLLQKRHKELAGFFAGKRLLIKETPPLIANMRVCDELPWLLTRGEDWDTLTNTLCNLDFIQAKAAAKMTYELVNDFNEALEVIPDNAENILQEKERQARMYRYTKDLIACAKGEITADELEIPESITPWTKEQTEAEIERIKTNPTNADLLKDFHHFLGNESSNLQNYACEFAHFTHQQAWNFANNGPIGRAAEMLEPVAGKTLLRRNPFTRPPWNPLPQAIQTLKRHISSVYTVSITFDGKRAFSGSSDKTCILWDLQSGEALQTLKGHTSSVYTVAITPDAKRAISGSSDKTCILWDLQSGKALQTLKGHTNAVSAVAITPDGNRAISCSSDKTCILWDLQSGEFLQIMKGHTSSVQAVAITPDSKQAISGSWDNTCILWDLESGRALQILEGHTASVHAVSITPDGKRAISGSWDVCILWDLQSGRALQTLEGHTSSVQAVSITPDGKRAISGSWDKNCILWDLKSGKALHTLKGHSFPVNDVSITPDGKRAISGSRDNSCILWDLKIGERLQTPKGHTSSVQAVAIIPNGKYAISSSWDKTCILWNLQNGEAFQTFKGHTSSVQAVAITSDGKRVISGSSDNTCILWNLKSGEALRTIKGHTSSVYAVYITPDGKRAISGSYDNTCIIWDLQSGEALQILKGHNSSVSAVSITPDGKRAVSGSYDNTCIIWDLQSGEVLQTLKGHNSSVSAVSITADGKRAITGSWDNVCILWNLQSGEMLQTMMGHTSWVNAIIITPDGKRAISGSWDKNCILWDLQGRKELARFLTNSVIFAVSLSPSGIFLGCSSGDVVLLDAHKELLNPGIAITTIRKIWDFELQRYLQLSADCPLCGHRFAPPASVLATIEEITKKAGLKLEQSPCLELPDEAWEEPGLLGNCPNCGEVLKFNPFVAGGEQ